MEIAKEQGFNLSNLFNNEDNNILKNKVDDSEVNKVSNLDGTIHRCPECNSDEIFHDKAQVICMNCGIVIEEGLPENRHGWRVFTEEDKRKIHAERTRVDKGLTTVIGGHYRDYAGNKLSPEMRLKMYRLTKRDYRQKTTREERVLSQSNNTIRLVCTKLRLPKSIREGSILFFKKHVKNELDGCLIGKSIKYVTLAVIYKICKDSGIPFKIEEVAKATNTDVKKIQRNYLDILRTISVDDRKMTKPIEYIPRFGSELKMNAESISTAYKIIKHITEHPSFKSVSMGKDIIGYSAAACYLASMMHGLRPMRNKDIVATLTNVAESTIKKRAEEITVLLDLNIGYYYDKYYRKYKNRYKNRFLKNRKDA